MYPYLRKTNVLPTYILMRAIQLNYLIWWEFKGWFKIWQKMIYWQKHEKVENVKNDENMKNHHFIYQYILKKYHKMKRRLNIRNRTKRGQKDDEKIMKAWKDDSWLNIDHTDFNASMDKQICSTVTNMIGHQREWMEFWPCCPNSQIYHL